MPIAELGYRHWQGERTGTVRRWLSITRSETAIALRSSKLLRRFLIFAWVPILYFCPVFLAVGYVANPANELGEGTLLTEIAREFLPADAIERLREDPEIILPGIWAVAFYWFFAYTQSFLSMIAVAIAGPPLIAKDLRSKAFLVYFSKPIQPWQYLLGKVATVAFFVFSMTLFPALLLYVVGIALSPDFGTVLATFPIVGRIVVSSLFIAIPNALVVLVLSSLTTHRRIATFAWLAVWIFGEIVFRVLTVGGNVGSEYQAPPWAGLLSIRELTTRATSGIFEVRANLQLLIEELGAADSRLEQNLLSIARDLGDPQLQEGSLRDAEILDLAGAGYPPIVSAIVLAALSAGCVLFLLRRVTKPVRI
jgi:hypothetical protein